jgi:hypothetical protein
MTDLVSENGSRDPSCGGAQLGVCGPFLAESLGKLHSFDRASPRFRWLTNRSFVKSYATVAAADG